MSRRTNKQGVINRDANATNRAMMAVQLRSQRLTFDEIANRCGYASPGAARNAVQRELQRVVVDNVDELRREEIAMLDKLHSECWQRMKDDNYAKSKMFAVDRIIAISERRSRLLGLDKAVGDIAVNQVVIREAPPMYLGEVVKA